MTILFINLQKINYIVHLPLVIMMLILRSMLREVYQYH